MGDKELNPFRDGVKVFLFGDVVQLLIGLVFVERVRTARVRGEVDDGGEGYGRGDMERNEPDGEDLGEGDVEF